MAKRVKIAMVGGGSYGWAPKLIRDVILTPGLEQSEFRLLDLNLKAAHEVASAGHRMAETWHVEPVFQPTSDAARAFDGADFVIITIAVGGLDTMQHDLRIPDRYGILQTKGDTVGPGGWSRGLRNVPVFTRLAGQIKKHAPRAAILNYSNPMTTITKALSLATDQPVVGLCHGLSVCYDALRTIFKLESDAEIKLNVAGIDHFFWLLDFSIRGKDGYAMLKRKMKDKDLARLSKESGIHVNYVCSELFDEYGKVPFLADLHMSEFFNRYLTNGEKTLQRYHIVPKTIAYRRGLAKEKHTRVLDMIKGKTLLEKTPSGETAKDIITAMTRGGDLVTVMNLPNRGQVSNLPSGSVVITLGVANHLGFTPLAAGPLPRNILNLTLPHVANQDLIVEAGLEGDMKKALDALVNDPLCAHLSIARIRKMGREMLDKNKRWLPQFYGKRAR